MSTAPFLQVAVPSKLLVGISTNNGYIHFMFVFRSHEEGTDLDLNLSYHLPVQEEGDWN